MHHDGAPGRHPSKPLRTWSSCPNAAPLNVRSACRFFVLEMREIRGQNNHYTTAEALGGKRPVADRSIACFGGSAPCSTHVTRLLTCHSTNIKPIACPRCKAFARLIERAPLPAGLEGEMRTLECKKCGKQTKMILKDQAATCRRAAMPTAFQLASGASETFGTVRTLGTAPRCRSRSQCSAALMRASAVFASCSWPCIRRLSAAARYSRGRKQVTGLQATLARLRR